MPKNLFRLQAVKGGGGLMMTAGFLVYLIVILDNYRSMKKTNKWCRFVVVVC